MNDTNWKASDLLSNTYEAMGIIFVEGMYNWASMHNLKLLNLLTFIYVLNVFIQIPS